MVTLKKINAGLPRVNEINRWYIPQDFAGMVPDNAEMLGHAYADIDADGDVSIALYSTSDARERRHYYEERGSVNITDIIYEWAFYGNMSRKEAVKEIKNKLNNSK